MFDFIYYCLYLLQVIRTKYYDIPKTYQDPKPHATAISVFIATTVFWTFAFIDYSRLLLLTNDVHKRYMILLYVAISITVISLLYFCRKGKSESVVLSFYENRGGIKKPDVLFGGIYFIGGFSAGPIYEIIRHLLKL